MGKSRTDNNTAELDKLFKTALDSGVSIDQENLVEPIDMVEIDVESSAYAIDLVTNLSKVYLDEELMSENPGLKKRIETFIESMRLLTKLKKSSERTHDILVASIPSQPTNASLYRSQAQIESNLISVQKQIDETIAAMTSTLKNYQLEINFREDSDQGSEQNSDKTVHRGSKTFIQQMRDKNSEQLDMFDGTTEEDLQYI